MSDSAHVAYVGLGSNLGKRERFLAEAVKLLQAHPSIQAVHSSPIYETDPVGYTDQPLFLNMVCRIQTSLSPEELLDAAMGIERALGRERHIRWGPRTIDIDLLLYDNIAMETPDLTLPHPRMMERMFVLVPLLDIMVPEERLWKPGFSGADTTVTGVRKWINCE